MPHHALSLTQSRGADAVTTATGGRLASKAPVFPVLKSPITNAVGANIVGANPELRRGRAHPRALGPLRDHG